MPATLGMIGKGVGGLASAFGGSGKAGPTSTMTSTHTGTTGNTGSETQTPNLNPLMGGFQSSLVPALSNMYAEASQPVYGKTQIAQVANAGNQATNAASSALSNSLAQRGALNSGANAAGQTALAQGNESNITGFENQIPLLNYQNEMQQQGNVLSLSEALTGKALSTNNTIGNSMQTTSGGSNTSATGPAFGAGALMNLGQGMASSGFGNSMYNAGKGGGKGTGSGEAPQTTGTPGGSNGDFGGET
jgi:hypothetical protein